MAPEQLTLALIVNPWAGLGGEAALKGSDGRDIQQQALALGVSPKASERVKVFLRALLPIRDSLRFLTYPAAMGQEQLASLGFCYELMTPLESLMWSEDESAHLPLCSAEDTRLAASHAAQKGVDVLLFAGGDGTARDVAAGLQAFPSQVCLGIPCGVKIQSGVYARSPEAAAAVLADFVTRGRVSIVKREVRDIDEAALRRGQVNSRYYADLWVPESDDEHFALQSSKEGSMQHSGDVAAAEALVHEEMAAFVIEQVCFEAGREDLLIVGAGTTTAALKRQLGEEGTLLGVDVFLGSKLLLRDANEQAIYDVLASLEDVHACKLLVSVIGGQGFVFGRGNQQLSARVIRAVRERSGDEALWILATERKLAGLPQGTLFVDTGDASLDRELAGSHRVLCHYEQFKLCRLVN